MAGRTISFKVPMWTANLLPNLLGLASIVMICWAIAALTDWRWGVLAGGIFGLAITVWMATSAPAGAEVKPLKRAA